MAVAATASANTSASKTSTESSGCQLGNGIKHVIDIVFDNVHVNRDNPNVLSDIEQRFRRSTTSSRATERCSRTTTRR
ncbi:MAG TPA: hypothetical protein VKR23_15460 [Gaiellaceae bacterium]|nr:hypothetical protein [Gaiellaceae bacterium]